MKKASIFFCFMLSFLVNWQNANGQSSGQVTIEGKQFKLNGANFYPMVMNYGVELTRQQNTNWNNSYLTPYVEYGVNAGPNGGPNSYFFECNNLNQCKNDILADWTYLVSRGFNTIRVAGFYTKFQDNPNKLFFKCRESYMDLEYYINLDPFTPGDPGCTFILDQYENLMQIAETAGVKLIFNLIGTNSQFTQFPGNNNDEIEFYNAFFNLLASRISISPFANSVLAVDLWNEPCYEDQSYIKDKQETCEIVSTWYNTFKSFGTTPLVTLGTCGSGDIWFYDPGVLKVDFFSLHIYPEWRAFEDKTDPAIQQRAISRVYDELYWFNKISPYPWIIGETSLAASANLQVQPQGGANGTLADQANYAQLIMDATCSCGGSGFSWWAFQDGWWLENTSIPHPAHWGILERGFSTGASAQKPVAALFNGTPPVVGSCGPCPVSSSSLQTYNSSLTYFNPFQHPPNPSNTIKGYVYDQDGNPIANAYVGGHEFVGVDQFGSDIHEYQHLFTSKNGYFEIIPFDNLPPNQSVLHTLAITASGGERLKYSSIWACLNCTTFLPTSNTTFGRTIKHFKYNYSGEMDNITIHSGEVRNLDANNDLTLTNIQVLSSGISEFKAKEKIHILPEVKLDYGSEVHIFCDNTSVACNNYSSFVMEYRLSGNVGSIIQNEPSFIEIYFDKDKRSSVFAIKPNPASNHFTIENYFTSPIEIKIFDLLGKCLATYLVSGKFESFEVSNLQKGIYILKESKTSYIQKLILQ